jgi:hypothetical protein
MSTSLTITRVSDNEFRIGANTVKFYNSNTIYVIAVGEQTTEMAKAHKILYQQLFKSAGTKLNYLIDLNKAGKNSSEARHIWKEISEDGRVDKVAAFGLHPVAKVLASFVMGISQKKNIQFFFTEKEAIKWLKE